MAHEREVVFTRGATGEVLRRYTLEFATVSDEFDFETKLRRNYGCVIRRVWNNGSSIYVCLSENEISWDEGKGFGLAETIRQQEERFVGMVNLYRALGYRMVVFDCPNGTSWLCCFDTKGIDADRFPIEAFANEDWLNDLHSYASWSGSIEDIEHMDVTDDLDEMLNYDYYANFPVMQLATF